MAGSHDRTRAALRRVDYNEAGIVFLLLSRRPASTGPRYLEISSGRPSPTACLHRCSLAGESGTEEKHRGQSGSILASATRLQNE